MFCGERLLIFQRWFDASFFPPSSVSWSCQMTELCVWVGSRAFVHCLKYFHVTAFVVQRSDILAVHIPGHMQVSKPLWTTINTFSAISLLELATLKWFKTQAKANSSVSAKVFKAHVQRHLTAQNSLSQPWPPHTPFPACFTYFPLQHPGFSSSAL